MEEGERKKKFNLILRKKLKTETCDSEDHSGLLTYSHVSSINLFSAVAKITTFAFAFIVCILLLCSSES
jgi:hypothetical protein